VLAATVVIWGVVAVRVEVALRMGIGIWPDSIGATGGGLCVWTTCSGMAEGPRWKRGWSKCEAGHSALPTGPTITAPGPGGATKFETVSVLLAL